MVLYILLTSLKTRMSTVYRTRKKEEINEEIAETNSIPADTPSTNARNVVVINEMRNARMKAIKRGLNDIILNAFGSLQCAQDTENLLRNC